MSAPSLSEAVWKELHAALDLIGVEQPKRGAFIRRFAGALESTLKLAEDHTLRAGQSEPVATKAEETLWIALRELVAVRDSVHNAGDPSWSVRCSKAWDAARAALASIPTDGTKDIDHE